MKIEKGVLDKISKAISKGLKKQKHLEDKTPENHIVIGVFDDTGWRGFKADTFWSLSLEYHKVHRKGDEDRLIKNFLYFLNDVDKPKKGTLGSFFKSLNTHRKNKKICCQILSVEYKSYIPQRFFSVILNLETLKYELIEENISKLDIRELFIRGVKK